MAVDKNQGVRQRLARRFAGQPGSYRRGDGRVAILFLLPDLIPFFVFTVLGVLATFGLSFVHWDLVATPHWVGLGNYRNLLDDDVFRKVLVNTAYYTLGVVPISTALALLLALALNL